MVSTKGWMALILLGGLLLRLPYLALPLANDELAISQSVKNWAQGRGLVYPNLDNSDTNTWQAVRPDPLPLYAHPPLEPLWVRLFVMLPLPLEAAVRLSTVVVGVLSILAAYLVGRAAFGERAGVWGAALFAVSKHGIFHYSFRTTKDGLAGLLALLAFWLYFTYLKDGKTWRLWAIGLLGGLSLLDRTSTVLWIGLLTAALVLQTKRRARRSLIPIGLSLVIFAGWVALDYWLTGWAWLRYMAGVEAVAPFQYTADLLFKQAVQLNHVLVALTPPLVLLAAVPILHALAAGVRSVAQSASSRWRKVRQAVEQPAVLLSLWVVGMLLAPLLFEGGGHHTEKYFDIAVPFVFVLAGAQVAKLPVRWALAGGAAVAGLALLRLVSLHDFLPHTLAYDGAGRLALLVWMLPFFLLPPLMAAGRIRPQSVALGLAFAFFAHALLFSGTVWTIANARAVEAGRQAEVPLLATKSEFVATALLVEDWAPDERLDKAYRYLPTVSEFKAFAATHRCTVLSAVGSYPLLLGCEQNDLAYADVNEAPAQGSESGMPEISPDGQEESDQRGCEDIPGADLAALLREVGA